MKTYVKYVRKYLGQFHSLYILGSRTWTRRSTINLKPFNLVYAIGLETVPLVGGVYAYPTSVAGLDTHYVGLRGRIFCLEGYGEMIDEAPEIAVHSQTLRVARKQIPPSELMLGPRDTRFPAPSGTVLLRSFTPTRIIGEVGLSKDPEMTRM